MNTEDPHNYLATEARIIAENKTHAVIAVRIDKAFIARNLPFLSALSELTPFREIGAALKNNGFF